MYSINVQIEGIAPLLFNRMSEKTADQIDRSITGGKRNQEQKMAEARDKVYRNNDGLYIPAINVKSAIVEGAKASSLKYGKKALWPFLQALVFVREKELSLGKKEEDFIDERMGRIPPRTGARALIRRPGIHEGWKLSFTLVVMDDRMPEQHIRTAIEESGLLKGLCDYRPEFGRFKLVSFEVKK